MLFGKHEQEAWLGWLAAHLSPSSFLSVSRVTVIFENHKQTSSCVYERAYKVKIHCALHLICLFVVDCYSYAFKVLCFPSKTWSSKLYLALKCFLEFLKVNPFLYFLDHNLGAGLLFSVIEKAIDGYFVWLLFFLLTQWKLAQGKGIFKNLNDIYIAFQFHW